MDARSSLGVAAAALAAAALLSPAAAAQSRDHRAGKGWLDVVVIDCSSGDYDYVTCPLPRGFRAVDARVLRHFSSADCDRGEDWDLRDDYIWVRDGCRAEFEVTSIGYRHGGPGGGLDGGPGSDEQRRRDELALRRATAECARAALEAAFDRGAWSAQYETHPTLHAVRRGSEIRGRVRLHDETGFYTVKSVCRLRYGEVSSFDLGG
jgi:hypothetical protein